MTTTLKPVLVWLDQVRGASTKLSYAVELLLLLLLLTAVVVVVVIVVVVAIVIAVVVVIIVIAVVVATAVVVVTLQGEKSLSQLEPDFFVSLGN